MKNQTLSLLLLLTGLIVSPTVAADTQNSNPQNEASPIKSHPMYKYGRRFGTAFLESLSEKSKQFCPPDCEEALGKVIQTIGSEKPTSEEHKKAFEEYKIFFKGQKSALDTYKPLHSKSKEALRANFSVKMQLALCDAIIEAPDSATMGTAMKNVQASLTDEAKQVMPTFIPNKVHFTLDTQHPFYKEGYAIGKIQCDWHTHEAQGKKIAHEDRATHMKRVNDFFKKNMSKESDQAIRTANVLQYLSGQEKALKEYPLEEILTQHKTQKDAADTLRLTYKASLESLARAMRSMSQPAAQTDAKNPKN